MTPPRPTSDGWRGLLGFDITAASMCSRARSIGTFLAGQGRSARVLVGYDTRIASDRIAIEVCRALSTYGIECHISKGPVPTPLVSKVVVQHGYDLGLVVTASHNPAQYSGLKVRLADGGPPGDAWLDLIESHAQGRPKTRLRDPREVDLTQAYAEACRTYIRGRLPMRVAVDSMYGTTSGLLAEILKPSNCEVTAVRSVRDAGFRGITPEPSIRSIRPLRQAMSRAAIRLGVAHDGDGDRIAGVDRDAGYLASAEVALLIAHHLSRVDRFTGAIVGTEVSTRRLGQLARALHLPYIEAPIGFRHSADVMRSREVLVAAEENGGIGFGFHIPDRDGTVAALKLLEVAASDGGVLGQLEEITEITSLSRLLRVDVPRTEATSELMGHLPSFLQRRFGFVRRTSAKYEGSNGDWLLVRHSGTEPIVRVYGETATDADTKRLVTSVASLLRRSR